MTIGRLALGCAPSAGGADPRNYKAVVIGRGFMMVVHFIQTCVLGAEVPL